MDKHAFFGQNAENPPIFVQNELTGTVPVSTLSGKNFEIRKNVTKFAA
jgi:hypothetical protein